MEAWVLVRRSLAVAIIAILIAGIHPNVAAKDRQRISFYKINKDGITQALRFTARKARKSGCHNFVRKARLHRVVQFGYRVCRVYAQKSCDADTLINFQLDSEPDSQTSDLTQGFGWYPVGEQERGEKAKSWYCE